MQTCIGSRAEVVLGAAISSTRKYATRSARRAAWSSALPFLRAYMLWIFDWFGFGGSSSLVRRLLVPGRCRVEHPDEPDQYTHVRPEDVNEVVRQLEVLLGATRAEVANKASRRNKFGTGSAPWQDIWDGDGMRDLDDFIRRHLGGLVSGE